jgi:hypothetical protein
MTPSQFNDGAAAIGAECRRLIDGSGSGATRHVAGRIGPMLSCKLIRVIMPAADASCGRDVDRAAPI